MRNELHISLKWLHWRVPRSHFFLVGTQKYLCLLETGERPSLLHISIRQRAFPHYKQRQSWADWMRAEVGDLPARCVLAHVWVSVLGHSP
jgi:hypothetical protein